MWFVPTALGHPIFRSTKKMGGQTDLKLEFEVQIPAGNWLR